MVTGEIYAQFPLKVGGLCSGVQATDTVARAVKDLQVKLSKLQGLHRFFGVVYHSASGAPLAIVHNGLCYTVDNPHPIPASKQ